MDDIIIKEDPFYRLQDGRNPLPPLPPQNTETFQIFEPGQDESDAGNEFDAFVCRNGKLFRAAIRGELRGEVT